MSAATCKSCGADIVWATTPNGRKMPLDPKPVMVCEISDQGELFEGASPEITRIVNGHVSHFATCPQASQHRKAQS